MYDTTLGRFLQRDPIGPAGDQSLYRYVLDNPTNKRDPLGEIDWNERPQYDKEKQGYYVKTATGKLVRVTRVNAKDPKERYYCHALTFGGKNAPGGPWNPEDIAVILAEEWTRIDCADARPGDIGVWMNQNEPAGGTPENGGAISHTAIFVDPQTETVNGQKQMDFSKSTICSKDGFSGPEQLLKADRSGYGRRIFCYRKKNAGNVDTEKVKKELMAECGKPPKN